MVYSMFIMYVYRAREKLHVFNEDVLEVLSSLSCVAASNMIDFKQLQVKIYWPIFPFIVSLSVSWHLTPTSVITQSSLFLRHHKLPSTEHWDSEEEKQQIKLELFTIMYWKSKVCVYFVLLSDCVNSLVSALGFWENVVFFPLFHRSQWGPETVWWLTFLYVQQKKEINTSS